VDTAALEQALATYRTMLRSARAAWKIAANVLKTHAGFNDAGQVTNPDQARATLKTAGSAIYECYRVAHYAEELLARALAEFRARHASRKRYQKRRRRAHQNINNGRGGSMWACLFSLVIDLCCNMSKAFGRGKTGYSYKGSV
jgi:hypothetical protein